MADATVTLKLNPSEFKLIQTALEIARQESLATAEAFKATGKIREMGQSRSEQVLFAELLAKLT